MWLGRSRNEMQFHDSHDEDENARDSTIAGLHHANPAPRSQYMYTPSTMEPITFSPISVSLPTASDPLGHNTNGSRIHKK